ncbi:DUF1489 family protein [Polycladidibacter stylochi]|uniref:DUF1489 family protein n=1 Tax=Polycladidibacter stylochi TaxID=1807766 RepID=UPI00082A6198|nr:DUF1489 domain-containing protein [Pseudovibrio stylochi]
MTLHLVKLCVGVDSVEQLRSYVEQRQIIALANGLSDEQIHTTRMVPTRSQELLDGGSLYWVIKGVIQARQKLIDIRVYNDNSGRKCCDLVMEPHVVNVQHQPKRPFQGWRYLKDGEQPQDSLRGASALDTSTMPEVMRLELEELCLI